MSVIASIWASNWFTPSSVDEGRVDNPFGWSAAWRGCSARPVANSGANPNICDRKVCETFRARAVYSPKVSVNASGLNPTRIVLPTFNVGARRLPVGPSIILISVSSSGRSFFNSICVNFLPFATSSLLIPLSSLRASGAPSRTLRASISSRV